MAARVCDLQGRMAWWQVIHQRSNRSVFGARNNALLLKKFLCTRRSKWSMHGLVPNSVTASVSKDGDAAVEHVQDLAGKGWTLGCAPQVLQEGRVNVPHDPHEADQKVARLNLVKHCSPRRLRTFAMTVPVPIGNTTAATTADVGPSFGVDIRCDRTDSGEVLDHDVNQWKVEHGYPCSGPRCSVPVAMDRSEHIIRGGNHVNVQ